MRFSFGEIVVGKRAYDHDVMIMVNGRVKARTKDFARREAGQLHSIGPKEIEEVCRGGPEVLFVGCTKTGEIALSESGRSGILSQRSIRCERSGKPCSSSMPTTSQKPVSRR